MAEATAEIGLNAAGGAAQGGTPEAATKPAPWQPFVDRVAAWSPQQKLAAGSALALALAMLVGVWLWSQPADQAVLFSNLDPQDGGAIVEQLKQQNIPYELAQGGSTILVPAQQVHELRLRFAAQGLPKGGTVGFELLDQQKLGITQFAEQVNYQRALEGELARSIATLAAVTQARVHLAIPKRTSFLRDQQKPTASVVLHLRPGRFLDETQIAGIRHLVASSIPNMDPADVSIVDQNGKLLTMTSDPLSQTLSAKQLAYRHELESRYRERIESLLAPVVGKPNFRAEVSLELDFDRIERTAETYRPNPAPNQAIRSQEIHERFGSDALPQGVPGALTNQPPVPATAPITNPEVPPTGSATGVQRERSATINYELDRTIEHVQKAQGAIKKLAVAVVVNQKREKTKEGEVVIPSDAELQQLEQLVKSALGFDPNRGDTITVRGVLFSDVPETDSRAWWQKLLEDPEMLEIVRELLRFLTVVIALTLIYFGVIRPLLRAVAPPKDEGKTEEETESAAGSHAASGVATAETQGGTPTAESGSTLVGGEGGKTPDALVHLSQLTPADPFEEKLATLRELTQTNPKLMANLIKEWLEGEEKKS